MSLERYAWLSIGAAFATIGLKTLAWWLTGSVGLLSDALESLVNLAAALLALAMLRVAASPPDEAHPYGFSKAEYFSAGIEGALIVLAAAGIFASGGLHFYKIPAQNLQAGRSDQLRDANCCCCRRS